MITGLCRPPAKPGGNRDMPWEQLSCLSLSQLPSSFSLRTETPEVPSSVGTVQSPLLAQAQEA